MSERCGPIRNRLSAWVDGELEPAEDTRVRAHVAECAECRAALEAFELVRESVAEEDLSRPDEEWERLAARVDAAVEEADEIDRRNARAHHGWRRPRRGFLGGLLPAPVAFGSAGTIVAAVLVALFFRWGATGVRDPELVPRGRPVVGSTAAGSTAAGSLPPAAGRDADAADREKARLEALGYVDEGGAGTAAATTTGTTTDSREGQLLDAGEAPRSPVRQVAGRAGTAGVAPLQPPEIPSAAKSVAPAPSADEERADEKAGALRPVEPSLRVTPPAASSPEAAPPEEEAEPPAAAAPAESGAKDSGTTAEPEMAETTGSVKESPPPATAPAPPPPRTLADFESDYRKQRPIASATPSVRGRDLEVRNRTAPPPDAMTRAIREQKREQSEALGLALARELYLLAKERREEGDRQGAIDALIPLLESEHGRIREQAWHELIDVEGEVALESGDPEEIARVAATADAFLREYPESRFRIGLLKRRIVLWGEAVEERPGVDCDAARAAEADWQAAVGAKSDPEGAAAAARIREHCPE